MTTEKLKTVTSIDGELVSPAKATISVFDNSLLYAEGLFETFLAVDDRLIFLNEHLRRLREGSKVINLPLPISRPTLVEWLRMTARAHPDHVKKVRLTVTSGESARYTGIQGKSRVIISASPHQMPRRPFSLHVSTFGVDQDSVFRRIKTISYGIHAAALKKAHRMKCDDALMINEQGDVAEATSANIFWVKRGTVYTPPLSSGCLDGVTRRATLKQAHKLGFRIKEANIKLPDLLKADEIFLSSSLKFVVAVDLIMVGNRKYRFADGPITAKLSAHFRRWAKI